MELKDLVDKYSHILEIKTSSSEEVFISGISSCEFPETDKIIFVKTKKFAEEFFRNVSEGDYRDYVLLLNKVVFSDADLVTKFKSASLVETSNFDLAMCEISKFFYTEKEKAQQCLLDGRQNGTCQVDPTVEIAQNVFIGENVTIAEGSRVLPGCVIMPGCSLGKGTLLFPNVTLYPETKIGENVLIHAGSVIGSDGFGYNQVSGEHKKIYHIGNVVIEDDVEIGANCTIDRGTFGSTIIGKGSKLDNMAHVAHNCIVGQNVIICGQSGLAGSVKVGDFSMLSGHVGVAPGVTVGEKCQIGGHSGVTGDVESGQIYSGYPARPLREWLRAQATLRKISKK